jgi:ABC-2 type transport system permease protein
VSVLIALSGVLSLVTIISIYREGGILRRLRATPLRPQTILTAHVLVKLALTLAHHGLDGVSGQALLPDPRWRSHLRICDGAADQHVEHPVNRFSDREHCAYGALRATDRRGHPVSDDGVCGLFVPLQSLPPALQVVARCCR